MAKKAKVIKNTENVPTILRTVTYFFTFIAVITSFFGVSDEIKQTSGTAILVFIIFIIGFILISFIMLYIIGMLYTIAGDKAYVRFKDIRDKNMFTYFLDSGVFLQDKHFWILTIAVSFALLDFSYTSSLPLLISMILIPVYLIYSARLNLFNVNPAAPETPKLQPKMPKVQPKRTKVQPKRTKEPIASIDATVSKLYQICKELEDEELISNVQEIIKYTNTLKEVLLKYPDAKKDELISEYNAHLLKFLTMYNEAEDLQLSNQASLNMMENTRAYAKDFVIMLRDILEGLYESNLEAADVNIEVMRKNMRIRGHVKD